MAMALVSTALPSAATALDGSTTRPTERSRPTASEADRPVAAGRPSFLAFEWAAAAADARAAARERAEQARAAAQAKAAKARALAAAKAAKAKAEAERRAAQARARAQATARARAEAARARSATAAKAKGEARTRVVTRSGSAQQARSTRTVTSSGSYRGRNHFSYPALGIDQSVSWFPCSRSREPDNLVYRWGCAGSNNVYLLAHAWGKFSSLNRAYYGGRLRAGQLVAYADAGGRTRYYRLAWWKTTLPLASSSWAWASQSRSALTLQTCVGANSEYRLFVRFYEVARP